MGILPVSLFFKKQFADNKQRNNYKNTIEMKNLSTKEIQDINGGGWIADLVEDILCALSCGGEQLYTPQELHMGGL